MTERLVSIHRRTDAHPLATHAGEMIAPSPDNPLIISASELRDFMRCRLKWWWRHQVRIEPKRRSSNLAIGTVVHQIMERFYRLDPSKRTRKRMVSIAKKVVATTTERSLMTEDLELIQAMVEGYAVWAKEEDEAIGLLKCEPEHAFELPLVPDGSVLVRGFIDNTFKSKAFRRTMGYLEVKTASQIRTDALELNLQLAVYLWAMRQLYPKAKRYIAYYTVLRKQMPGPRVRADLFHREIIERTDTEIDQWVRDTQLAAMDMLNPSIYPNPTRDCNWDCDYRHACMQRGDDADVMHILKTEFKTKEKRQ